MILHPSIGGSSKVLAPLLHPLHNVLKDECIGGMKRPKRVSPSSKLYKKMVTKVPILAPPDFTKLFEVECDASNVGIGGVRSQENKSIAFFLVKIKWFLQELLYIQQDVLCHSASLRSLEPLPPHQTFHLV